MQDFVWFQFLLYFSNAWAFFFSFILVIWYTPSQRGNYHHSMFRNPTAAVNLFHVGKQYLTLCKAEAAETRHLIGRKIISSVKRSDTRNSCSLPMHFRRHTLKSQTPQCVRVLQMNATSNDRCPLYVLERHLTFRRNIDTRRQWSVGNIG